MRISVRNSVKTLLPGLVLAGALCAAMAVPAPGKTPCAPGAAAGTARGWEFYRAGSIAAAREEFTAALRECPSDSDAEVGLGFVLLRGEQPNKARRRFEAVVARSPAYADAHYGLALCCERLGRKAEARAHILRALELDASREDFRAAGRRLDPPPPPPLPPASRPSSLQLDFRVARGTGFEVLSSSGWKPVFIKGINLGAALPGKFPGEFPGREVYARWLGEIAEAGFNLIRVYTIHPPWFYEELREHNLKAGQPIYLLHGVWAEPPPKSDFQDPKWFGAWKLEMERVADLLHGRANLPERPGQASGAYRADVSPWVMAYILGREWEPEDIVAFNKKFRGEKDFNGRFALCRGGHAAELFMARAMEHMLAYEHDTYFTQRPMAYTNWPTLDPLTHPTESSKAEEAALRKKFKHPLEKGREIVEYDNDALGLDMEKVDPGPESKAGFFASYHAYPYYPDFMNLDPGYLKGRDDQGPSNYSAYLLDLVGYHRKHAVLIGEFGVPSSRLVAHWQAQGMTHGGQNEREQGEQDVRLFRNIRDSGCAGGILFAWLDEWFKKNWLVIEFESPPDRKPLWYNSQDAEENYGLIGLRPGTGGPAILIDGKPDEWESVPVYQAGDGFKVRLLADEGWLHAGISWAPGAFNPAGGGLLLGLDTFDKELGDHKLPFGLGLSSEAGLESAVLFQGGRAAVYLDEPYDLFTHRYRRPYRTENNDRGVFLMPRTESNRFRLGRDGTRFPEHIQEIGWLKRGTQDRAAADFDSGAEWLEGPGFLEARIPWGLLNVTDPSSRRVLQDGKKRKKGPVDTAVTEGVRAVLAVFEGDAQAGGAKTLLTLPRSGSGQVPAPPVFSWDSWEEPSFHEYRKASFELVRQGLLALPDTPQPPR